MKKNFGPKFGSKGPKSIPKLVFFCHFFKFGTLLFLEISWNDSLQQCLTCSWGIIVNKKSGGPDLGQVRFERQTCQFLQILKAITC